MDTGFIVARWLAALCGAISVFLVGRVSLYTWGPVAGIVSALVYASFPETVLIERGPFLEPLLNVTCLSAANLWLVPSPSGREERSWVLAGMLFGLAISVKLVGGIWLIAALLSRPLSSTWNVRPQAFLLFAVGGAVTLLWGAFLLQAPSEFFSQVFFYQALRPADGALSHMGRLHELFPERRLVSIGLALLGLVLVAIRAFRAVQPTRTVERFFAVAYVLTITAFLSSPSYWNQFNTFAASDSVLAGLAAAAIHEGLVGWFPHRARPHRLAVVPGRVAASLGGPAGGAWPEGTGSAGARPLHPRDSPRRRTALHVRACLGAPRGKAAARHSRGAARGGLLCGDAAQRDALG